MPRPRFSHEDLDVYQYALETYGQVHGQVQSWDRVHAVVDHLIRAFESIIENLAAAGAATSAAKFRSLDYSLGSTLECAACFDIALLKGLIDADGRTQRKREVLRVFKMLIGLRTAWSQSTTKEERPNYKVSDSSNEAGIIFNHESLDVYQVALDLMRWFCAKETTAKLTSATFRKLDKPATSIVLNVAEGNGRYAELDHRNFIAIAHQSSIKMAARLDLCVRNGSIEPTAVEEGKKLLVRVASMTAVMARGKK